MNNETRAMMRKLCSVASWIGWGYCIGAFVEADRLSPVFFGVLLVGAIGDLAFRPRAAAPSN